MLTLKITNMLRSFERWSRLEQLTVEGFKIMLSYTLKDSVTSDQEATKPDYEIEHIHSGASKVSKNGKVIYSGKLPIPIYLETSYDAVAGLPIDATKQHLLITSETTLKALLNGDRRALHKLKDRYNIYSCITSNEMYNHWLSLCGVFMLDDVSDLVNWYSVVVLTKDDLKSHIVRGWLSTRKIFIVDEDKPETIEHVIEDVINHNNNNVYTPVARQVSQAQDVYNLMNHPEVIEYSKIIAKILKGELHAE